MSVLIGQRNYYLSVSKQKMETLSVFLRHIVYTLSPPSHTFPHLHTFPTTCLSVIIPPGEMWSSNGVGWFVSSFVRLFLTLFVWFLEKQKPDFHGIWMSLLSVRGQNQSSASKPPYWNYFTRLWFKKSSPNLANRQNRTKYAWPSTKFKMASCLRFSARLCVLSLGFFTFSGWHSPHIWHHHLVVLSIFVSQAPTFVAAGPLFRLGHCSMHAISVH